MSLVIERLRTAREEKGLSQRKLARLCGLGQLQIHRYESGLADPSTDSLKTIASILAVSADYLLGLSDEPHAQLGVQFANNDERTILEAFRREGWPGVGRLIVDQLVKCEGI